MSSLGLLLVQPSIIQGPIFSTDMSQLVKYIQVIEDGLISGSLAQILLADPLTKDATLRKIQIKPIELKEKLHLSFVYKHQRKDITKNYLPEEAIKLIKIELTENFRQSYTQTTNGEYHFHKLPNGKIKLKHKPNSKSAEPDLKHDHSKKALISSKDSIWKLLEFTNDQGQVYKDKQKKFRQINRYIEIIKNNFEALDTLDIVDMGCGKAYLTFALYSYLNSNFKKPISFQGVELREELVTLNNNIAKKAGFKDLSFICESIENFQPKNLNVLIALHACDTATDDSILKGIQANAELIVCSPCCHKQVRKSLESEHAKSNINKHGILQERLCEIITDVIRAGVLEAYGYKTKVMEFIATTHTPKNLLIIASKKSGNLIQPSREVMDDLHQTLKDNGIKNHYLLDQLEIDRGQ